MGWVSALSEGVGAEEAGVRQDLNTAQEII